MFTMCSGRAFPIGIILTKKCDFCDNVLVRVKTGSWSVEEWEWGVKVEDRMQDRWLSIL